MLNDIVIQIKEQQIIPEGKGECFWEEMRLDEIEMTREFVRFSVKVGEAWGF